MKEKLHISAAAAWCERQIDRTGADLVDLEPLRVEASNRCFYRVRSSTGTQILMTSPPELERNDVFIALAQVFGEHNIPVPTVIARDDEAGYFLMSDLGATHLEDVYDSKQQTAALTAAIDILPRLAAVKDPLIEPYTTDRLEMELGIYIEWLLEGLLGYTRADALPSDIQTTFRHLVAEIDMQPKGCVHRDYHCRNLLFSDEKLGIVDFQDALHGPILYDVASLLRDCYYSFDEATIAHWLSFFKSRTIEISSISADIVQKWFDYTAIQRQLKAIGIFARLHLRDSKSSHLPHIVPVARRLITLTASYPGLAPINLQLIGCIEELEEHILRMITSPERNS